jgi:CobQ-like glutamine amidotransferase family enzyme
MELKLIHFYPDLMSLYGSYANVAVLKRRLEQMGNTVTVEPVVPGQSCDITSGDFIFMGAGTERAQKAALTDFIRYESAVKKAAEGGVPMLFAGTSMELMGKSITDDAGKEYTALGLTNFTSVQSKKRFVEDVYGVTDLYPEPVVGFVNKSSTISGVETPLLTAVQLGYGNEGLKTPEGFRYKNVIGSHLTGPILVKNPRLLDKVITAIYEKRGEALPAERPADRWTEDGYAITAEALKQRI